METVTIKLGWHKASATYAASYKQIDFINNLRNDDNCPDWDINFSSSTNAMRQLTKSAASDIIEALKNGDKVVFE